MLAQPDFGEFGCDGSQLRLELGRRHVDTAALVQADGSVTDCEKSAVGADGPG